MKASPSNLALRQQSTVPVHFTRDIFSHDNGIISGLFDSSSQRKLLVFNELPCPIKRHDPIRKIFDYTAYHHLELDLVEVRSELLSEKPATQRQVETGLILRAITKHCAKHHSYILAVGGGTFLDAIGAYTGRANHSIRLIRMPTTVLEQMCPGSGIKKAFNYVGNKIRTRTFVPPFAVVNDLNFLHRPPYRDWREGIAKAIRLAVMQDGDLFGQIERDISLIVGVFKPAGLERLVIRCSELHMESTGSEGVFENGSIQPLSFGGWAADKLEVASDDLGHGAAVAIGVAIDSIYSQLEGRLSSVDCDRILHLLSALNFDLWVPECDGLEEFREHLGGRLMGPLPETIGRGVLVHQLDADLFKRTLQALLSKATRFSISKQRGFRYPP